MKYLVWFEPLEVEADSEEEAKEKVQRLTAYNPRISDVQEVEGCGSPS